MKCVKADTTGEVKRVDGREARRLVAYGWRYVPKAEWKAYKANGLRLAAKGRRV